VLSPITGRLSRRYGPGYEDRSGSAYSCEGILLLIVYYVGFMIAGDLSDYLIGLIVEREFGSQASLIQTWCPMPSHKFQIGETVYVRPAISRNVPGGAYAVTKQLPHNGREFEYRIKSANEEHERVVRESELTKA
jgi:hypothetical protein